MNTQCFFRRRGTATVSVLILCLVFAASNVGAAPIPIAQGDSQDPENTANPPEEQDESETPPYHEVHLGFGGSGEGAFMLISWTGKRRVGVYFKPYFLDDNRPARANSTVVQESAGELGFAFRAHPAVTLGAGYGTHDREVTVYGGPSFLFGIPVTLEETEENDTGLAGVILVTLPSGGKKIGWSFALSAGPAGVGASVQVSLRIPK